MVTKQTMKVIFFDKSYTRILKGACCIIVILVHVPATHGNKLQDAIGSFGFVAVTIFFMISAYGMYFSKQKKTDYLRHFWRNRLSSLLIPMLLVNIANFLYDVVRGGYRFSTIIQLNGWVWVLLQFCILFYLVEVGEHYRLYKEKVTRILLVVGVTASSLLLYFLYYNSENSAHAGWCYERMGLVWGLTLLWCMPSIRKMVMPNSKKIVLSTLLCAVLGVAYLKFKFEFFWGQYLLKIILGVSIIYLLFALTSLRKWGNKVANFLGDISYEVYLSHGFVMAIVATYLPSLPSGIFILSSVILTIAFSWFIHSISKPMVKALRY